MAGSTSGFQASVRLVAQHELHQEPGHPGLDELISYQAGELSGKQAEQLQDHLFICKKCAAAILDLRELTGKEPVDTANDCTPSQEMVTAAYQSVQNRLQDDGRVLQPVVAWALAASFLLTTLGLAAWVLQLRHTVGELSGPRLNIVVTDLVPATDTRRDHGIARVVGLPRSSDGVLLVLNLGDLRPFPSYHVEITDRDGKVVWKSSRLVRTPFENFSIELPSSFLSGGEYKISVFGTGEPAEVLAEYLIRVETESESE
jgi:hypothetical protein